MWRSQSFMLYVGSSCALDFPQIGFCFSCASDGLSQVYLGASALLWSKLPILTFLPI